MDTKYLLPALLYADEIEKKTMGMIHSKDWFFYNGCPVHHPLTIDRNSDNRDYYQYAIVDPKEKDGEKAKLVGYISYHLDYACEAVYNFGLIGFDKNNPIIGIGIKETMDYLLTLPIHTIEWRCVGGNPVRYHYERFIHAIERNPKVAKVERHCFEDYQKDEQGEFHDMFTYRIILYREITKNKYNK